MAERQGSGYFVILLTFLVAAVLSVLPLPEWLQWARPEWLTLTLIYWCIALPHRVLLPPPVRCLYNVSFIIILFFFLLESKQLKRKENREREEKRTIVAAPKTKAGGRRKDADHRGSLI